MKYKSRIGIILFYGTPQKTVNRPVGTTPSLITCSKYTKTTHVRPVAEIHVLLRPLPYQPLPTARRGSESVGVQNPSNDVTASLSFPTRQSRPWAENGVVVNKKKQKLLGSDLFVSCCSTTIARFVFPRLRQLSVSGASKIFIRLEVTQRTERPPVQSRLQRHHRRRNLRKILAIKFRARGFKTAITCLFTVVRFDGFIECNFPSLHNNFLPNRLEDTFESPKQITESINAPQTIDALQLSNINQFYQVWHFPTTAPACH